VLGDRILAPEFQRALEKYFIDYMSSASISTWYEAMIFAFANLPATSPALQVLVDRQCSEHEVDKDNEEELALQSQLPNSFLVRVMNRYSVLLEGSCKELDRCDYHRHEAEEEKETCQKEGPEELIVDSLSDDESK
jgi:hypothetical protein